MSSFGGAPFPTRRLRCHYLCLRLGSSNSFCRNGNLQLQQMVFLIFPGQILKKTILTLQELRLKLNSQTYISSKSIMQLTEMSFSDSAIFLEKRTAENRSRAKSNLLWLNCFIHGRDGGGRGPGRGWTLEPCPAP